MSKLRTIEKFLLFPRRCDGRWYWLKRVLLHQEKVYVHALPPEGIPSDMMISKWVTRKIETVKGIQIVPAMARVVLAHRS